MGLSKRDGTIITFWPDDDEDTIHQPTSYDFTMQDAIDLAKEKWGDDVDLNDIIIRSEYINTDCLGHDRYYPDDYTCFVVIERR